MSITLKKITGFLTKYNFKYSFILGLITLVLLLSFQNCQSQNSFKPITTTADNSISQISFSVTMANPNNCNDGMILKIEKAGSFFSEKPYSFDNGKTFDVSDSKVYKVTTPIQIGQIQIKDSKGNIVSNTEAFTINTVTCTKVSSLKNDTQAPTLRISTDSSLKCGQTVVRVFGDDDVGLADDAYSFDNGQSWSTEVTHIYTPVNSTDTNLTLPAGSIQVKDSSGKIGKLNQATTVTISSCPADNPNAAGTTTCSASFGFYCEPAGSNNIKPCIDYSEYATCQGSNNQPSCPNGTSSIGNCNPPPVQTTDKCIITPGYYCSSDTAKLKACDSITVTNGNSNWISPTTANPNTSATNCAYEVLCNNSIQIKGKNACIAPNSNSPSHIETNGSDLEYNVNSNNLNIYGKSIDNENIIIANGVYNITLDSAIEIVTLPVNTLNDLITKYQFLKTGNSVKILDINNLLVVTSTLPEKGLTIYDVNGNQLANIKIMNDASVCLNDYEIPNSTSNIVNKSYGCSIWSKYKYPVNPTCTNSYGIQNNSDSSCISLTSRNFIDPTYFLTTDEKLKITPSSTRKNSFKLNGSTGSEHVTFEPGVIGIILDQTLEKIHIPYDLNSLYYKQNGNSFNIFLNQSSNFPIATIYPKDTLNSTQGTQIFGDNTEPVFVYFSNVSTNRICIGKNVVPSTLGYLEGPNYVVCTQ